MSNSLVLTVASSAVTGVAGYLLKYFLDRKQAAASAGADYKRRMYQDFVETLLDFYQNANLDEQAQAERTKKFANDTKEFQKKYVLDASPAVIRAIKKQQAFFKRSQEAGELMNGRKASRANTLIFKKMRRDIGTSNWGLGWSGGVILSPVLMYAYENDMHPVWWRIKKQIKKRFKVVSVPLVHVQRKIKKQFYEWGEKD